MDCAYLKMMYLLEEYLFEDVVLISTKMMNKGGVNQCDHQTSHSPLPSSHQFLSSELGMGTVEKSVTLRLCSRTKDRY